METIVIHQSRIKPILHFHPWIFSGAVKQFPKHRKAGIVEVKAENGQLLGYGFADAESQISCRMFHFGSVEMAEFPQTYWNEKFDTAFALRKGLLITDQTDTYRLLHAEGDGMPGIIADVYGGKTVVIHTLIGITTTMIDQWRLALKHLGYKSIYQKSGHEKEGTWILGKAQTQILAKENGLKFSVDVEKGQKTGFFIDQRDNRQIIKHLSKNKKVLNAFGYTGGFSVYALSGGANEVVTVDISESACQESIKNVAENQLDASKHKAVKADCFEYLKEMSDDFDVIVLDPPAFAKSKSTVDKAARGYKEINLSAFRKIKTGGLLATFSCSQHIDKELFRKIIFAAAADSGRSVRIIQQLTQPLDHPINIYHPEGEYLKGLLLYVE